MQHQGVPQGTRALQVFYPDVMFVYVVVWFAAPRTLMLELRASCAVAAATANLPLCASAAVRLSL